MYSGDIRLPADRLHAPGYVLLFAAVDRTRGYPWPAFFPEAVLTLDSDGVNNYSLLICSWLQIGGRYLPLLKDSGVPRC